MYNHTKVLNNLINSLRMCKGNQKNLMKLLLLMIFSLENKNKSKIQKKWNKLIMNLNKMQSQNQKLRQNKIVTHMLSLNGKVKMKIR